MTTQGWAAALALAILGYAWHDALGGRFPRAGRWALLALLAAAGLVAFLNPEVEHLAFAFGAAPALGWALRLPRPADGAPAARAALDAGLGLAYAGLVALAAFAWSFETMAWGFVVGAVLVVARVVLVEPFLAARAARRPPDAADDAPAPPTTVK